MNDELNSGNPEERLAHGISAVPDLSLTHQTKPQEIQTGMGFDARCACDQSWIAEFGLITDGFDEKCIHWNDAFWFWLWCHNQPILSTVFSPNASAQVEKHQL